MVAETRYVPGSGALVGAGALWVLFSDPADDRVLEEVWQVAAHASTDPTALDRIVRIVENAFGGFPSALAVIDLRHPEARTVARGTGDIRVDGNSHILTLGSERFSGSPDDIQRRIASGVVAASAARISPMATPTGAATASSGDAVPAGGPGLIDGVPAAILAARGPDGPPPPRRRLNTADLEVPTDMPLASGDAAYAPATPAPDPVIDEPYGDPVQDVDALSPDQAVPAPAYDTPAQEYDEASLADMPAPETTAARLARLEAEAAPAAAPAHDEATSGEYDDHDGSTVHRPAAHLEASDAPTVLTVYCPLGHPSSPALPDCRLCHQRIAPQEPRTAPRPALGGLRLPTGEVVPLDRGVVIGRKPTPVPGSSDWPHLVHLPSDHSFVSRMHLQIELHGWDVIARDLGSRGGTTLTYPGRPPMPMRGGEAYVLSPGTVVDLAAVYAVRFETGAGAQ